MDEIKKQLAALKQSFADYATQYKGLGPKLNAVHVGIGAVEDAVSKFETELANPKPSQ
jgi:hypothetical protein